MRYIILFFLFFLTAQPAIAGLNNTTGPGGIDAAGFANLSTALSSPATAGKTVIIETPMTINTKHTDRAISIINGGSINVSSGSTLYINGSFSAGMYRVFTGVGNILFGTDSVQTVYPKWWYAGAGAYTSAINTAFTAFNRVTLAFGKTYDLGSGTITTSANSIFDIEGATITSSASTVLALGLASTVNGKGASINTTSVAAGAAVRSANQSGSNNVRIYGWPQIQISDPSVSGSIGIDGSGFYASHIQANVDGFATGVLYYGTDATSFYNVLDNPKIGTGVGGTAIYLNGGIGGAAATNAVQIISPFISGHNVGLVGISVRDSANVLIIGGYIEAFDPTNVDVRGIIIDGGTNVTVVGPAIDSDPNAGIPIEIKGTTGNVSIINPSFAFTTAPYNIKNTSGSNSVYLIGCVGEIFGTPTMSMSANNLSLAGMTTQGKDHKYQGVLISGISTATTIYTFVGSGTMASTVKLSISGRDSEGYYFYDEVVGIASSNPVTIQSQATYGAPSTRTYTITGNDLKLAYSSGTTSIIVSAVELF